MDLRSPTLTLAYRLSSTLEKFVAEISQRPSCRQFLADHRQVGVSWVAPGSAKTSEPDPSNHQSCVGLGVVGVLLESHLDLGRLSHLRPPLHYRGYVEATSAVTVPAAAELSVIGRFEPPVPPPNR
jgi:hypothetical protein